MIPSFQLRTRRIIWVCAAVLCLAAVSHADQLTQSFLDGIRYYQEGDYERAVLEFKKITDAGVQNGRLYYNLGNAYLRSNQLGHAMLWYERALELIPEDPDLKFNYAYALSRTKDERADRGPSLIRILFFWKFLLNPTLIRRIAIAMNLLFWLAVLVRLIRGKKVMKTPIYLLLFVTLIFTGTAAYHYYEDTYIREGIILPEQVSVRSGLTEGATELFVLHAGTKIRVEKEKDGFFRIFFSEGKIGWIKKDQVGII
ncbi:MAG: tetratricopeptide repeat protein [Thermodesulfobacteriota bacterium]